MDERDEINLRVEAMRLAVKIYLESQTDEVDGVVTIAQSIFKFFKSGE